MQLAFKILDPKISVFLFCSEGLIYPSTQQKALMTRYCLQRQTSAFHLSSLLFQFIGCCSKLVLRHQCFPSVLNTYERLEDIPCGVSPNQTFPIYTFQQSSPGGLLQSLGNFFGCIIFLFLLVRTLLWYKWKDVSKKHSCASKQKRLLFLELQTPFHVNCLLSLLLVKMRKMYLLCFQPLMLECLFVCRIIHKQLSGFLGGQMGLG